MENIIRGTTPTLTYTCTSDDVVLSEMAEIWFTIKQISTDTEVTYMKSKNEIVINDEEKSASVIMSQADTLRFKSEKVSIQLRALATDGKAYATDIFDVNINRILKGGVMSA